jgi:hypothetical protein
MLSRGIVHASHRGKVRALRREIMGVQHKEAVGLLLRGIADTPRYREVVDLWWKEIMEVLPSRIIPLPSIQATHTHSNPAAPTPPTRAVHTQCSPAVPTQSTPVVHTPSKEAAHTPCNPAVPTHTWPANDDNLIMMSRTITGVWVDGG